MTDRADDPRRVAMEWQGTQIKWAVEWDREKVEARMVKAMTDAIQAGNDADYWALARAIFDALDPEGTRRMTDNDPRVEAAMDVLAALAPDGDSPPYYAVEEALQAADAVDPLRQPGVIRRVAGAKRVSEPDDDC